MGRGMNGMLIARINADFPVRGGRTLPPPLSGLGEVSGGRFDSGFGELRGGSTIPRGKAGSGRRPRRSAVTPPREFAAGCQAPSGALQTTRPFTMVAAGPPRKRQPWNGEFLLFDSVALTS